MKRLTKEYYYDGVLYGTPKPIKDDSKYAEYTQKVYNKLGELEDLEDKLGISLVTLIRALFLVKNIYVVKNHQVYPVSVEPSINMDDHGFYINLDAGHWGHFYLQDYRKTWGLAENDFIRRKSK